MTADSTTRQATPSTFYKAVRLDGTDFFTGAVQWAPPAGHDGPWGVRHPVSTRIERRFHGVNYASCLCLSDTPADCTGFEWPARLLVVEAPGAVHDHCHKWVTLTARVVGERPACELFGPQGEHIIALIDAVRGITREQVSAMRNIRRGAPAWGAAWDIAWEAAPNTGREAARDAALGAIWDTAARGTATSAAQDAVRDTAVALIVRDLILTEYYDELTRPLRLTGITVHPDDPEITR